MFLSSGQHRGTWPYAADGASVGHLGTTKTVNAPQPWSVRFNPNGTNFQRFEVRPGDKWSGDVGTDKERAEMAFTAPALSFNTDYWFAWSFNIDYPDNHESTLHIMGQLHATKDAGDVAASPVMDITLVGAGADDAGDLAIRTRTSTEDPLTSSPSPTTHYTSQNFPRHTWHNAVFRVNIDPGGGGLLQFWLNGSQVVDYSGAIGYVDATGPYWKWGLYSGEVSYNRIVKYANMEFGTASLASRVSSPLEIIDA